MRTLYLYLFTSIGIAFCWLNGTQQAHGQLSQTLSDFKYDRPFQYAPGDPWTRSKLFNRQTKHYGFGYNCDGEECKRNSPYICWKTHTEKDLPSRTGWWQRLNQTAAEVKQRIAEGSCIACAEADPCQRCQQRKCGGCCDCQGSTRVILATNDSNGIAAEALINQKSPVEIVDAYATETWQPNRNKKSLIPESKSNRRASTPVRTAGLESLDTRVK